MATKVIMPKQGLQMTEGTITRWIVPEGDQTVADQPLFEMETDKLTIEIMAPASGTLLKVLHPAGDTVPITQTIAIIGEPGDSIAALMADAGRETGSDAAAETEPAGATVAGSAAGSTAGASAAGSQTVYMTPRARTKAEEAGIDATRLRGTGPEGLVIERDVLAAAAAPAMSAAETPKATPVARRIAGLNAIDLAGIAGMGPGGKIMKSDVQAALAQPQAQPAIPAAQAPSDAAMAARGPRRTRRAPGFALRHAQGDCRPHVHQPAHDGAGQPPQ